MNPVMAPAADGEPVFLVEQEFALPAGFVVDIHAPAAFADVTDRVQRKVKLPFFSVFF